MFSLHLLLAAGSLSLISGAPVSSPLTGLKSRAPHSLETRGTYTTSFGGTGAISDGWPALNDWVSSFDDMFEANIPILKSSCAQWNVPDNSDDEISDIRSSIKSVGSEANVDPRFILAVVIQESNGCVRAPTTVYSISNPGLMQSHEGTGSCNNGAVLTPCPSDQIHQMIVDGVQGTATGDGLKGCLEKANADDATKYYKAARIYNSGSVDASQNLGQGVATHCYVSDVANRLLGWATGPSKCSPDLIGTLTGNAGGFTPNTSGGDDNTGDDNSDPAPVDNPTPVVPAPTSTSTPAPKPTPDVVKPTPDAPEPTPESNGGVFVPKPVTTTTSTPVAPAPTPDPTPAVVSPPATNEPATAGNVLTPGSDCATDGEWNCITEATFQRCASGKWSVVQQVSQGTKCAVGQSAAIQITHADSKRAVGHDHFAQAHVAKHARHVFW
jgi:hypothetical protein